MAYDESDTCWHILTVTRGGTVSILKNLDAPTARQTYQRLRPDSRPTKSINRPVLPESQGISWSGGWGHCGDGDITKVDIIGPEGADLDPWRGVPPLLLDLTATWASGHAQYVKSEADVMPLDDANKLLAQRGRQRVDAP